MKNNFNLLGYKRISISMERNFSNVVFRIVKADITERRVDAIVNAANSYLRHGGGVAAAILRKGGPTIQEESNKIGYVPVGSAVVTSSGNLSCNWVIHAVGPRMGEGQEDLKLRKVIENVLKVATRNKIKSISIPAISSGIFRFPKDKCAEILIDESRKFVQQNSDKFLTLIEFCIFDEETYAYFKKELEKNSIS